MKLVFSFYLLLGISHALKLRCGDGQVEARDDYFGLWSEAADVIYADNELALFYDDQCYYFGRKQMHTWKRLGGLTLPVNNGKVLSMEQVLQYNQLLYHLKQKNTKIILRKQLLTELQTHVDRIGSIKNQLLIPFLGENL